MEEKTRKELSRIIKGYLYDTCPDAGPKLVERIVSEITSACEEHGEVSLAMMQRWLDERKKTIGGTERFSDGGRDRVIYAVETGVFDPSREPKKQRQEINFESFIKHLDELGFEQDTDNVIWYMVEPTINWCCNEGGMGVDGIRKWLRSAVEWMLRNDVRQVSGMMLLFKKSRSTAKLGIPFDEIEKKAAESKAWWDSFNDGSWIDGEEGTAMREAFER